MEQFKFALGPYEIFASIIGSIPLTLAIFLVYNPVIKIQEIISVVQGNASTQIVIVIIFFSYILGGLIQGITWKYFLFLCKTFNRDFRYFGTMIEDKSAAVIEKVDENTNLKTLDFEDKLILLLHEKIGIPKKIDWLNSRVVAYLKENNRPSLVTAELYQATHIMYRNISFSFLILGFVLLINLFRNGSFTFEYEASILLSIVLCGIAFFRSLSFKRWNDREVLLGFYFAASDNKGNNLLS